MEEKGERPVLSALLATVAPVRGSTTGMAQIKEDSLSTPLQKVVADEREKARAEARGMHWNFVRSRGTFLCTADASGQCAPQPAAECPTWKGTYKEVRELHELVLARYPNVTQIYIEGGFDGAETLQEFTDCNYEPWVSAWEITLWTKERGWEPFVWRKN